MQCDCEIANARYTHYVTYDRILEHSFSNISNTPINVISYEVYDTIDSTPCN